MTIRVQLNDRSVSLEGTASILDLLAQEKQGLWRPNLCREQQWIHNPRCPLVNLIEVDGNVVPLAAWSNRPLGDGMVVRTRSEQLEAVLREQLVHPREHR